MHQEIALINIQIQLLEIRKLLMATLQQVKDAVTKEETVEASIIALTNALAANSADPATLDALVAQINADAAAMATAVTANTPVAPTPTPVVTPAV